MNGQSGTKGTSRKFRTLNFGQETAAGLVHLDALTDLVTPYRHTAKDMSVQKVPLHCPTLEEVAKVLQQGLAANFANAQVNVVDCPDLTQKPFMLADKGLCGSAKLADVGGVPNLTPLVNREKIYNLEKLAEETSTPGAFIVGAGAGPAHKIGVNSELVANMCAARNGKPVVNCTHIAKVNTETGNCQVEKSPTTDYMLMGNFFISDGQPGKVLEVKASKRTGPQNMMVCLREALKNHYGTQPVGLGGTFLIESGKAKLHVMPDFSACPLETDEAVNNWLKFYDLPAPLVCLGHLVSHDPGLELRMEHFHCFSDCGNGGHYHYDVTPDDVSYLGYFNVGEFLYRVDQPASS